MSCSLKILQASLDRLYDSNEMLLPPDQNAFSQDNISLINEYIDHGWAPAAQLQRWRDGTDGRSDPGWLPTLYKQDDGLRPVLDAFQAQGGGLSQVIAFNQQLASVFTSISDFLNCKPGLQALSDLDLATISLSDESDKAKAMNAAVNATKAAYDALKPLLTMPASVSEPMLHVLDKTQGIFATPAFADFSSQMDQSLIADPDGLAGVALGVDHAFEQMKPLVYQIRQSLFSMSDFYGTRLQAYLSACVAELPILYGALFTEYTINGLMEQFEIVETTANLLHNMISMITQTDGCADYDYGVFDTLELNQGIVPSQDKKVLFDKSDQIQRILAVGINCIDVEEVADGQLLLSGTAPSTPTGQYDFNMTMTNHFNVYRVGSTWIHCPRPPPNDPNNPFSLIDTGAATFTPANKDSEVATWSEYAMYVPFTVDFPVHVLPVTINVAMWLTQVHYGEKGVNAYVYADNIDEKGFNAILQTNIDLDGTNPVSFNWIAFDYSNPIVESGVVVKQLYWTDAQRYGSDGSVTFSHTFENPRVAMGFHRVQVNAKSRAILGFEASKTGLNWALGTWRKADLLEPQFQLAATWIAIDTP